MVDNIPVISEILKEIKEEYEGLHVEIWDYLRSPENSFDQIEVKQEFAFDLYFNRLPVFSNKIREALKKSR